MTAFDTFPRYVVLNYTYGLMTRETGRNKDCALWTAYSVPWGTKQDGCRLVDQYRLLKYDRGDGSKAIPNTNVI